MTTLHCLTNTDGKYVSMSELGCRKEDYQRSIRESLARQRHGSHPAAYLCDQYLIAKPVSIETCTVGHCFATCAIIRGFRRARIAVTENRPFGFDGRATEDALALAESLGFC